MSDLISKEVAIDMLTAVRDLVWDVDIPSPTVPEYIEHHEQMQSIMKNIDILTDKITKMPSAQPETHEKRTETHACDCISREAALNCFHDWVDHRGDVHTPDEMAEYRAIEALPSVQQWIPCSERLPEESGQYIITVKYVHVDGYEDVYAEHGEWDGDRWDMFCFGHCGKVESIIAWMPLPEPYKEGENG